MTQAVSRILVPVDFSAHSDEALRYAASLARHVGASLELLHVVEDPFMSGAWSSEVYVPSVPELLDNLVADARRRLADLKNRSVPEGVPAAIAVVRGRPAQATIDRAKDGHFDLIVMGTHGRTGFAHLILGSVAETVVRRAPCPVLTVRQAQRPAEQAASTSAAATV